MVGMWKQLLQHTHVYLHMYIFKRLSELEGISKTSVHHCTSKIENDYAQKLLLSSIM